MLRRQTTHVRVAVGAMQELQGRLTLVTQSYKETVGFVVAWVHRPKALVAPDFGRAVRTLGPHGYVAFQPAPMPRTVGLGPDTVMKWPRASTVCGPWISRLRVQLRVFT